MFLLDNRSFCTFILASLLLASLCLQSAPVSAGKIYRWVDEQGQLHFSDSPQNAPAELRQDAKEYQPSASSLTVTSPSLPSAAAPPRPAGPSGGPKDSISIPYTAKEGSANRVIIDITFNGAVTAPILVDTGSPGLIISDDLADQLGLFDKNGTLDSIEYFYPRLNDGGIILCDDYGSALCPGATQAIDEFLSDKPEKVLYMPCGNGFMIKNQSTAGQISNLVMID